MPLWLLLTVLSFATFRLTRLITRDDFPPVFAARWWVQHLRPTIVRKDGSTDWWWLGELASCPWCASAYLSGGLVLVTWLIGYSLPVPVFCWLAVWGAGALLAYAAE